MQYELVIFDWDGTLMDSTPRIISSMLTASEQAGLPVPSAEAVKNIIGLSMEPAFIQLFGMQHADKGELLLQHYRQAYIHEDNTPSPLYEGALQLLDYLSEQSRCQLAVATGKARPGLERVWQQSQTQHFFHASRCGDEAESKPSPDMLQQILEELSIPPSKALMVGDTSYDMAMAEELGMDRVGLTHGAHNKAQLVQHTPTVIFDSLYDLQHWLSE